jgi:hypothetical protein
MIDFLIKELDTEMTEAETEEKVARTAIRSQTRRSLMAD